MITHIQKWGNSLAIRIPISLIEKLNLKSGTAVEVDIDDDHLVIHKKTYELDSLLNQINAENKHNILLDDRSLGHEAW